MRKKKFSLMEMVIVVAIIAMVAAIVAPNYFKNIKKAGKSSAKAQIKILEQCVLDFYLDTGKYPSSLNNLVSGSSTNWDGPYIKYLPKDPWGNDYQYSYPGSHGDFDIYSYGSDNQQGGSKDGADITNWQK